MRASLSVVAPCLCDRPCRISACERRYPSWRRASAITRAGSRRASVAIRRGAVPLRCPCRISACERRYPSWRLLGDRPCRISACERRYPSWRLLGDRPCPIGMREGAIALQHRTSRYAGFNLGESSALDAARPILWVLTGNQISVAMHGVDDELDAFAFEHGELQGLEPFLDPGPRQVRRGPGSHRRRRRAQAKARRRGVP